MSGGSYNYAWERVEDFVSIIRKKDCPLRRAFAEHMVLVAKAMGDIEMVDSGDYGQGDEIESIQAVLAPGAELAAAILMAKEARDVLDAAIKFAEEKS